MEVVVGAAFRVFAFGEDAAFELLELQARGFAFLQRVQIIEPLEEKQLGDLLDDFERIGDAAGLKAFQRASILLRISPVRMGRGASARHLGGATKNSPLPAHISFSIRSLSHCLIML